VDGISDALSSADREATERVAQGLADHISRRLSIPAPEVSVRGHRPPDGDGELHGIYRPGEGRERDRICLWMRTAKQRKVVATPTFLRTLLHELGHHIDMQLLDLPTSYHTKGFYQRESSLFRVVTQGSRLRGGPAKTPRRAPEPKQTPPATDVQLGLSLLRAAVDDIRGRGRSDR